jgi:hypothetical protein
MQNASCTVFLPVKIDLQRNMHIRHSFCLHPAPECKNASPLSSLRNRPPVPPSPARLLPASRGHKLEACPRGDGEVLPRRGGARLDRGGETAPWLTSGVELLHGQCRAPHGQAPWPAGKTRPPVGKKMLLDGLLRGTTSARGRSGSHRRWRSAPALLSVRAAMLAGPRRTACQSTPVGPGLAWISSSGNGAPPSQRPLDPGREGSRGEGRAAPAYGRTEDGSERISLGFFTCAVRELDFFGAVAFAMQYPNFRMGLRFGCFFVGDSLNILSYQHDAYARYSNTNIQIKLQSSLPHI